MTKMIEKYLVCSDIHDDIEALEKFADFSQVEEADRILVLGDFSLRPYTADDLEQLIKIEDTQSFIRVKRKHTQNMLNEMKNILKKTEIPYSVIPGNYDSNHDIEAVFNNNNLHKKTTTFGEAEVFGYGGADAFPSHILLLCQLDEITPFDNQELYNLLKKEMPDIILTHNPPHQFCDNMFDGQNKGTPATTKHIMEFAPRLVLSGHIHEAGPLGNNPNGVQGFSGYQNKKTDEQRGQHASVQGKEPRQRRMAVLVATDDQPLHRWTDAPARTCVT